VPVGEHVDLHDAPAGDREADHGEGAPTAGHHEPRCPVDERRAGELEGCVAHVVARVVDVETVKITGGVPERYADRTSGHAMTPTKPVYSANSESSTNSSTPAR
jgi:hypothetical protein